MVGLVGLPITTMLLVFLATYPQGWDIRVILAFLLFAIAELCMLAVVILGAWSLIRLDRHPDIKALARYGPPLEIVAAVDAELAARKEVTRIGSGLRSFHMRIENELGFNEVYVTPSWLVHFAGPELSHLQVFHLDSLILAGRRDEQHVVLVDRHGVENEILGTEAGLTRLLAEILARVPWALNRFDEKTERSWHDDRNQIIAAVDRKRQGIQ